MPFAYCEGVGSSPTQSVEGNAGERLAWAPCALDGSLVEELWQECDGASFGLERVEFQEILQQAGTAQNFGLTEGTNASREQQAGYLNGLKLSELMLAHACAAGKDRAWEQFVATYRQPLMRAA